MFKKASILFLVVFLGGLILPLTSFAGVYQADSTTVYYEGLVPCGLGKPICDAPFENGSCPGNLVPTGSEDGISCQFCHFFVMIDGIIDFLLIDIVPPLAILMIVAGAVMFYFGGGKPELISKGKTVIKSVIIGLLLIYGAFIIVNTFLSILGVVEWTGLTGGSWFKINCQITL